MLQYELSPREAAVGPADNFRIAKLIAALARPFHLPFQLDSFLLVPHSAVRWCQEKHRNTITVLHPAIRSIFCYPYCVKRLSAGSPDNYCIIPYTSVGPVSFGMTRRSVTARLGPAINEIDDNIMGEIRLYWPGLVCYFEPKTLVAVQLEQSIRVSFKEIELFTAKNVLGQLKQKDAGHDDGGEYANFPALGICLGGFGKRRIPEGRLVFAYCKARAQLFTLMNT